MTSFTRGIETAIAPVRRSKGRPHAIVVAVSPAECKFLLARLADVSATAEAIVHHPRPGHHISSWDRHHVVEKLIAIVRVLRTPPANLFIVTPLERLIFVEAIENNPYFAAMHDSDPRLSVGAVRQAEALRQRLATALGQPIARVPLGRGRTRLPEPA
jgi:hypothetical protein